jgi:hypothetical protein
MPFTSITTILPTITQVAKAAGSIVQLVKDTETRQKIIELQTSILDLHDRVRQAQVEQDELVKVKDELERKLLEHQQWGAEAARYELRQLADGIFVYALKAEHKEGQPDHFLCPHCFEQKKRSILQHPVAGYANYMCHACKFEIVPVRPAVGFATVQRRDRFGGLL